MTFADLLRDDSGDRLQAFVDAWHGPTASLPGSLPPVRLPDPLRRLLALADARPALIVQNRLLSHAEQAGEGDRQVFYVENQGVFEWATNESGPDSVVWGRFNDRDRRWQAEREPLSRFLLQLVVFEAIMGAPYGASASWLDLPTLEAVLAPLEQMPWGSWRWPTEPSWFFAGSDVLAFTCPNGRSPSAAADHFDVWLGSQDPTSLAHLHDLGSIRWDREPPRSG